MGGDDRILGVRRADWWRWPTRRREWVGLLIVFFAPLAAIGRGLADPEGRWVALGFLVFWLAIWTPVAFVALRRRARRDGRGSRTPESSP